LQNTGLKSKPAQPRRSLRYYIGNTWAVLQAYWSLRHADHLGKKVRAYGSPWVVNAGRLIIHDRVQLVSTLAPIELAVVNGGTLEIGESVYINYGCSIAASELIRIGARCSFGPYVMVLDNNFHSLSPEHRNEPPQSAPVVIEENVWLGARAIILPGVRIGEGSVIGAGSVVTHNIPPRVLAAGNPAKIIRGI
jgi:acetyltransferase-like isoleucine patch superfamily enzyme